MPTGPIVARWVENNGTLQFTPTSVAMLEYHYAFIDWSMSNVRMMNPLRRAIQQKRSIVLFRLDECGTYVAMTDVSSER